MLFCYFIHDHHGVHIFVSCYLKDVTMNAIVEGDSTSSIQWDPAAAYFPWQLADSHYYQQHAPVNLLSIQFNAFYT